MIHTKVTSNSTKSVRWHTPHVWPLQLLAAVDEAPPPLLLPSTASTAILSKSSKTFNSMSPMTHNIGHVHAATLFHSTNPDVANVIIGTMGNVRAGGPSRPSRVPRRIPVVLSGLRIGHAAMN